MKSQRVVVTTIFDPTPAVLAFAQMNDVGLIVVGDKKSPGEWAVEGVEYFAWDDRRMERWHLFKELPFNHYSRKNLGYLRAIESGAPAIVDTDDDNIPYEDFSFPPFDGQVMTTEPELGFVNAYSFFTSQKIWPRGLPLQMVLRDDRNLPLEMANVQVGIWQGLADGDPDVDAIYRLTINEPCKFDSRDPIALAKGTWSPFNSQNTFFRRELFPLLYLPVSVSFRFTDILRSFVAQPIMWEMGYVLGVSNASVFQDRNFHDHLADFSSEVPMYELSDKLTGALTESQKTEGSILDRLWRGYDCLAGQKVVTADEMRAVDAWIKDCGVLGFR